MKKLAVLMIVMGLALSTTSAFAKEWKTIRVGVEGAYPPFSYLTTDGKLAGFDIEIAEALVKASGAQIKLVAQDWDGIIPALLAGKYDCIVASMSITEERKKKVAFTHKYYHTPARFTAKKGMFPEFTPEAVKGKVVGVQRSTIHDRYLTDNYGDAVTIKRYASQDEVYIDLLAGRIDMFISDSVAASTGFLNKPDGKDYEFVGPELTNPKWFGEGAGIAVKKQDTELVNILNAAIDKIRADGTYQKIAAKYFDFNIYGE